MVPLNKHRFPHQQIFLYPLKVALISVKFVSGKSTCLSDFGSAREAGGHRLLSYILLLVRPEVQMLGGEFIPSILRLLLPVPGKALGGGDIAVNKQPLPSWSLPSRGGEQRVSSLLVIDGIKQVKPSDMVSSIYCCIMTPFLKLSDSKLLFNLLVILQSGLNSAARLFC